MTINISQVWDSKRFAIVLIINLIFTGITIALYRWVGIGAVLVWTSVMSFFNYISGEAALKKRKESANVITVGEDCCKKYLLNNSTCILLKNHKGRCCAYVEMGEDESACDMPVRCPSYMECVVIGDHTHSCVMIKGHYGKCYSFVSAVVKRTEEDHDEELHG